MSLVSGAVNDLGTAAEKAGDELLNTGTTDLTQQIIPSLAAALEKLAAGKRLVITNTTTIHIEDKIMGPTLDPQ
jgi:hypothetical protein